MKTITNKFKIALVAIGLLSIGTMSAQITSTTDAGLNKDTGRRAGGTADDETSIRLIDNKGTIKYLQAKNGLTQITATSAGNRTTTTWQLGGTLNSDTYIDANGNTFALDGLELVTDLATASTNNDADLNESDHGGATTGFTILIRDEATGKTQKIRASDLLQVQGVRVEETAAADSTANLDITVTDITAAVPLFKVSVFRNGAKLRAGVDYVLGAGVVTVQPQTTAPNDWEIYTGDIFEIHWIK